MFQAQGFWAMLKTESNANRLIVLVLLSYPALLLTVRGSMRICLVMGFFIFGLTVELFDLKMTASFFAFTLAILMAAATHHDDPEMAPK